MNRMRSLLLGLLAIAGLTGSGYAARTLTSPKFTLTMSSQESSALALGSAQYNPSLPGGNFNYTVGTGAGAVSLQWSDTSTIGISGADTIRLMGTGGPTNAFNQSFDFGKIKTMGITCAATNTNDIIIGNAADSTWVGPFGSATHTIACRPGEVIGFAIPGTGYTVSATAKKLKLANGSGTTSKYTIMFFGVP